MAEFGHDSAAASRSRARERAISRIEASVVREHRPAVNGPCIPVENQNSTFAEIEFGMHGLGFYRGAVLSFVALRLSGQGFA